MTIKEYVLDALGKFWNKLKGSYITPMQNDIETIESNLFTNVGTAVTDFNSITTPGTYYVADMTQVSNAPSSVTFTFAHSGQLQVIPRGTSSRVFQILYVYMGNPQPLEFIRCMTGENAWGSWYKYPTLDDAPFLGIGGTEIISDQDLNDFKTPGNYYCNGNTAVATLVNCPTTSAFKMFVSNPTGGSTSYVGQEIKVFDGNVRFYRWYGLGDDTWRDWQKLAPASGAASSIWTSNLTTGRALISNTSGKITVSSVTSAELGYLSGATSAIQTQINGKAPTSHASSATTYGIGTGGNYGHVKLSDTYASTVANNAAANGMGASQKALYTAYNALSTSKQANITGGASTITTSNLTTSRVLVSSSAGKVAVSSITTTQLGYLSGVTNAIQTQINAFKQGAQTVTASAMPAFGMISGGQKSVVLFVPWYKQISGSTITCSSLKTSLRHVSGGYIGGAQGYTATSLVAGIVRRTNNSIMQITITRTTAFEAANNTPVCGTIDATFVFS